METSESETNETHPDLKTNQVGHLIKDIEMIDRTIEEFLKVCANAFILT